MTPRHQQQLQTDRLVLVPLDDTHLEHEVELDSDPEVLRFISGRAHSRDEVERMHANRIANAGPVPGLGYWAGFVGETFVGLWILKPPKRADQGPFAGQAELGYRLPQRRWRQGLAREGARELVRYGFDDVGLDRIFAETLTENGRSRAIMAALGMAYERTFRQPFADDAWGQGHDVVVYAISRQEWAGRRADR
jgi:RimJ/RimL family protein N-acetyltransferase